MLFFNQYEKETVIISCPKYFNSVLRFVLIKQL